MSLFIIYFSVIYLILKELKKTGKKLLFQIVVIYHFGTKKYTINLINTNKIK